MKNQFATAGERRRHELLQLRRHDARMEADCLVCHTAIPGRVCPDCYLCRACGQGCDECAEVRPR